VSGCVGAASLGAATLFIAHYLGGSGDTMQMMEAVLDTNFWLATHVVCVTQGYVATIVAGFLGLAFIIMGVFTPYLNKEWIKTLGQATYGVLCFATLLSFTGTVLGGIWADQSWGRFWGWDPKENGAVLIVIWNALILHARWSGLIKERGMAVLTVFGNIVTAWSWFGTNQLGVGLHAYGFNNKLATGCAVFWVANLVLLGVGCLPYRFWWSFNAAKYTPPPVQKPKLEKVSV
jgi:ABC-type transport system involved in cytochrome c biogenesis permease subunit